jgi:hypothetical protein
MELSEFSEFEVRVLHAIVQGDPEIVIRSQLDGAIVKNRDFTGVGVYTQIQVLENSERLRWSSRYIKETPKLHLEHPELPAGAGVLLWFKDGYVATLECYTNGGRQWPEDESLFTIAGRNLEIGDDSKGT